MDQYSDLTYDMLPSSWHYCFLDGCPKADQCIRHLSSRVIPDNETAGYAILPYHLHAAPDYVLHLGALLIEFEVTLPALADGDELTLSAVKVHISFNRTKTILILQSLLSVEDNLNIFLFIFFNSLERPIRCITEQKWQKWVDIFRSGWTNGWTKRSTCFHLIPLNSILRRINHKFNICSLL